MLCNDRSRRTVRDYCEWAFLTGRMLFCLVATRPLGQRCVARQNDKLEIGLEQFFFESRGLDGDWLGVIYCF